MRLGGQRKSTNVDDRRGKGVPMAMGGGLGAVVLIIIVMLMGGDPTQLLSQMQQGGGGSAGQSQPIDPAQEPLKDEIERVLGSTEDVWTKLFRQQGETYKLPTLVLFNGQVQSACGMAGAAVGPFYCPGDSQLYIDLTFYDQLAKQLGAPGDFARAYVVAHEVGHHIQNLQGISRWSHQQRQQLSEAEYNKLSVRIELQADFYAGVWAHHARGLLEAGDIEEGLRAAEAIGDDALQKQAQGYVVPDSFTHGTSAQRAAWFRKGFETGDMTQGDTLRLADPD